MKTEEMICELRRLEEVHKDDFVGTGETNWSLMCYDVANRLEELLKAQEPVKPILDIRHGKSMWRCGSCSTALQPNQMHAKFCFNCGKAVRWE